PYLGMGNNPINGIDSDGGYVYIIGGDPELKERLMKVLIAKLGRETVEWFANNPHNHIHIGYTDGVTIGLDGSQTGMHYGVTLGSRGILSSSDSYITKQDIANKHGDKIASY